MRPVCSPSGTLRQRTTTEASLDRLSPEGQATEEGKKMGTFTAVLNTIYIYIATVSYVHSNVVMVFVESTAQMLWHKIYTLIQLWSHILPHIYLLTISSPDILSVHGGVYH